MFSDPAGMGAWGYGPTPPGSSFQQVPTQPTPPPTPSLTPAQLQALASGTAPIFTTTPAEPIERFVPNAPALHIHSVEHVATIPPVDRATYVPPPAPPPATGMSTGAKVAIVGAIAVVGVGAWYFLLRK